MPLLQIYKRQLRVKKSFERSSLAVLIAMHSSQVCPWESTGPSIYIPLCWNIAVYSLYCMLSQKLSEINEPHRSHTGAFTRFRYLTRTTLSHTCGHIADTRSSMHISFSAIILSREMIIWHHAQILASEFSNSSRVNAELRVKWGWALASPGAAFLSVALLLLCA